jgi:hypothetical protein
MKRIRNAGKNADKAARSGSVIIMIIDVRRCTGVLLDLVIRYAPDRIHIHGLLSSHRVLPNDDVRVLPPCSTSIHANENESESENGRVSVVWHVMERQVHGVDHDILPCLEK